MAPADLEQINGAGPGIDRAEELLPLVPEQPQRLHSQAVRLATCCGGIMTMLAVYGIQQERIMAVQYGTEYFTYTVFLVLLNRLFACSYAVAMALYNGEDLRSSCPVWKYFLVAVSNVLATTCQYEALKYVSFPVQMLGKSSKMVPVMGWGIMMGGKSYIVRDWIIAFSVTIGCTMFLAGGEVSSAKARSDPDMAVNLATAFGLLLMLGYLASDGFTSTFQEKLFKDHNVSTYNQMFWVNTCAVLLSTGLLLSGGLLESIAFAQRHPWFIVDAVILSLSATLGQVFIYQTIFHFGALVFAATMNARQLMSILISVESQHHPVTIIQALGVALTFGGLFTKVFFGYAETTESKQERPKSAVSHA
jgi:adenosine 3'-phospho 5'-phosphosulfate transporter B2